MRARVEVLESRLDLDSLQPRPTDALEFNDLGAVRIAVSHPLALDRHAENRATGGFILIDEATHHTVAAGMVESF